MALENLENLTTDELQELVDQRKITPAEMLENLHWDSGIGPDESDCKNGKIVSTCDVYGYTQADEEKGDFSYDNFIWMSNLKYEYDPKTKQVKIFPENLTAQEEMIVQNYAYEICESIKQNIESNFYNLIDVAKQPTKKQS